MVLSPAAWALGAGYLAVRVVAQFAAGALAQRAGGVTGPAGLGLQLLPPGVFGVAFALNAVSVIGADALLTETPEWSLVPVIRQTLERQPHLAFITVADFQGRIQADADVRALVEKTGIPYLPMSMAKGLLPDTHKQSAAAARSYVLPEADVVMLIGARLNWLLSQGKGKTWGGKGAKDADRTERIALFELYGAICGDAIVNRP